MSIISEKLEGRIERYLKNHHSTSSKYYLLSRIKGLHNDGNLCVKTLVDVIAEEKNTPFKKQIGFNVDSEASKP